MIRTRQGTRGVPTFLTDTNTITHITTSVYTTTITQKPQSVCHTHINITLYYQARFTTTSDYTHTRRWLTDCIQCCTDAVSRQHAYHATHTIPNKNQATRVSCAPTVQHNIADTREILPKHIHASTLKSGQDIGEIENEEGEYYKTGRPDTHTSTDSFAVLSLNTSSHLCWSGTEYTITALQLGLQVYIWSSDTHRSH